MKYDTMKAALRLTDVQRYHMVRMTQGQNVAEHSFRVATIAIRIASLAGFEKHEQHAIFFHAAMHDIKEHEQGDLPTQTKVAIRNKGLDMDDLGRNFTNTPAAFKWVIKAADLIESIAFMKHQPMANYHTGQVFEDIKRKFSSFQNTLTEADLNAVNAVHDEAVYFEDRLEFDLEWKQVKQ